jgi:putative ABC transport system ATP-binding protein
MTSVIEARGLLRRYPAAAAPIRAVDGVDLVVEAGETVSVMGPSGCGKSTLLHLLGGLERPDAGELYLGGRRVDRLSETQWAILRRSGIGFVFQAFHLVDELTSVENVELPALLLGAAARRGAGRWSCWTCWAWPSVLAIFPTACQAASGGVWRWRGR